MENEECNTKDLHIFPRMNEATLTEKWWESRAFVRGQFGVEGGFGGDSAEEVQEKWGYKNQML